MLEFYGEFLKVVVTIEGQGETHKVDAHNNLILSTMSTIKSKAYIIDLRKEVSDVGTASSR